MPRFGKTLGTAADFCMLPPCFASVQVLKKLVWSLAIFAVVIHTGIQCPSMDAAEIEIGISGHYRVGRWTGVRVDIPNRVTSLETRDGDGVEVRYAQSESPNVGENSNPARWNYVIPGSEAAPLIVRDENGIAISSRFPTTGSPSRGPAMIPLGMPWLVIVGDPLGVDQIGVNRLLDRDALIAVSRPDTARDFPDSSLGYDGVDMMMIGGSSRQLLAELSTIQQQAIVEWVTGGGRLFVTLGQSAPELLEAAPWLFSLLPIENIELVRIDPSSMETFTSSQSPLRSFEGSLLPRDKGRVIIMGRTTRRVTTPIAMDVNVGFGSLTIVAADLEQEMFAQWPERLDLITQITGSILDPIEDNDRRKSRKTAYNDLAGQIRSSLDQFSIKREFGFSLVSLILMALIAAIGPLDYLLLNRFFGRPLLGWFTFPLVAVGLSVILIYQTQPAALADQQTESSSECYQRCNRIEIVDIDSTMDVGRGFSLNYLYSHDAIQTDVRITASPMLSAMTKRTQRMLTSPFGYPGESFGGIQIAIEDSRLPVYEVPFELSSTQDGGSELSCFLENLPLASRSSKGILMGSRFIPELSSKQIMERRPGSELLRGDLVNPLQVDLLDGILIYRNWTYLLPTRFSAGGRIAAVDTLRQKNFRWQLSRQTSLETEGETEAWDPGQRRAIDRITEMLMFHDAVGGTRYTTLLHEPLSYLDLSHLLTDKRCILMGRVVDPATEFTATIGDDEVEPPGDRLTLVRVVLPVADPKQQE